MQEKWKYILYDRARARQFWRENTDIGSADGRGWASCVTMKIELDSYTIFS